MYSGIAHTVGNHVELNLGMQKRGHSIVGRVRFRGRKAVPLLERRSFSTVQRRSGFLYAPLSRACKTSSHFLYLRSHRRLSNEGFFKDALSEPIFWAFAIHVLTNKVPQ